MKLAGTSMLNSICPLWTSSFSNYQWLLFGVQEEKADQRLRKEAQVTLYRNYRVGDFPDIQISYSSLITPLQALAQVKLQLLFPKKWSGCKYT